MWKVYDLAELLLAVQGCMSDTPDVKETETSINSREAVSAVKGTESKPRIHGWGSVVLAVKV